MEDNKKYSIFIALYVLFIIVLCVLRVGGEKYFEITKSFIYASIFIIVSLVGFLSVKQIGLDNFLGKSILLLSLSIMFWSLGGTLWPLFPQLEFSPSDGLWYLGYLLMYVGLSFAIQGSYKSFFEKKIKIFYSFLAIILFFFLYLRFFPISWDSTASDTQNLVTVGYILLDLFMIIPTILLFFSKWGKDLNMSWIIISFSLVINLLSDVLYNVFYDSTFMVGLIELTWFICYLAYPFAFLHMMQTKSISPVLTKKARKVKK